MLPAPDPGALRAFLEHPFRPAGTLTYHELQGFLFTVVSAPESIPASEWIPIIFAGEDVDYASVDEANKVLGQIMTLYNTINATVLDPPTLLPADCPLRDDVLTNFDDDAPLAQWRFERKARTVAALNHPHICTLHDIGSQDGIDFLVMEYLDGETVAQRLEKGALPLDQALQIAIDMADALDKAHRQGIVHRDLKPANIMLTKVGAKLLDFGLAKLKPPEQAGGLSALPTQPANLTQQGAILGTFQYMAPEQLEGQEADARTDIFAFGAVVYEMVTGRKAFEGKSQASLIGAILKDTPPAITTLQPILPAALDPLVTSCLAKDPEDRWQSIGDVGRQLQLLASSSQPGVVVTSEPRGASVNWAGWRLGVVGLVIGSVVTGLAVWNLSRPPETATDILRITMAGPQIARPGLFVGFDVSADGTKIVYPAPRSNGVGTEFYLRSLDALDSTLLRATENWAFGFFSPDGEAVGFHGEPGNIERLSVFGGAPQRVARLEDVVAGASWGSDDQIVVGTARGGLFRVPARGGEPVAITALDAGRGEISHAWPSIIPDRDAVLFVAKSGNALTNSELAVLSLETGEIARLGLAGTCPRYVPTGHLVYVAEDSSLRSAPFDKEQLTVTGSPVTLLEGIFVTNGGEAAVRISDNGRLIYMPAISAAGSVELVWVDRQGQVVASIMSGLSNYHPRLSPDGNTVAVPVDGDLRLLDLTRGIDTRLTENGGSFPVWTPDGSTVMFSSNRAGAFDFYTRPADLTRPTELLLDVEDAIVPGSWSPDGDWLVFYAVSPNTRRDLWMMRIGEEPAPFLRTEFNESNPRLSPMVDGCPTHRISRGNTASTSGRFLRATKLSPSPRDLVFKLFGRATVENSSFAMGTRCSRW